MMSTNVLFPTQSSTKVSHVVHNLFLGSHYCYSYLTAPCFGGIRIRTGPMVHSMAFQLKHTNPRKKNGKHYISLLGQANQCCSLPRHRGTRHTSARRVKLASKGKGHAWNYFTQDPCGTLLGERTDFLRIASPILSTLWHHTSRY